MPHAIIRPIREDATDAAGDPLLLAFASEADRTAYREAQAEYARHRAKLMQYGGGCSDMQALHRAAFPAFNEAGKLLDRLRRNAERLRRDLDGIPHPTPLRDALRALPAG